MEGGQPTGASGHLQSQMSQQSQGEDAKNLNPASLGNISFNLLNEITGKAQEAFTFALTKIDSLLPKLEGSALLTGAYNWIEKFKEALSHVHGAGVPHAGEDTGLGGSAMSDAILHNGHVMDRNGVEHHGNSPVHSIGGLHPDQQAQIAQMHQRSQRG